MLVCNKFYQNVVFGYFHWYTPIKFPVFTLWDWVIKKTFLTRKDKAHELSAWLLTHDKTMCWNRKVFFFFPSNSSTTHFDTTNTTTCHMMSCGWWRGDNGFMWGHLSTNHNTPYDKLWHILCQNVWHKTFFFFFPITKACTVLWFSDVLTCNK